MEINKFQIFLLFGSYLKGRGQNPLARCDETKNLISFSFVMMFSIVTAENGKN
jgi:hypothetical protein